ncbi:MAG: adenosylcobinamide-phosphate synthase CbiB [Actinomycetota bacterium]
MRLADLVGRVPSPNRPLSVAFGLLTDRFTREPPNELHPVAWFGTAMGEVERAVWADRRNAGVAYTAVGVVVGAAAGHRMRSLSTVVSIAVAGGELRRTAQHVAGALEAGDVQLARDRLPALVGRDPSELDASAISAAVIESVAENSVDAVFAPAFWGLVAGAPGAAAYRAINTMDAMVGHRSERYERFGWAAARLDDVANWIPARIFALCVAVQQPDRFAVVVRLVRRDAPGHPSPNAGVAETAMAGAIDRQLGGPLRYGDRVEHRPRLGDGDRPEPADVARAVRIADRAEWIATGALGLAGLLRLRRR